MRMRDRLSDDRNAQDLFKGLLGIGRNSLGERFSERMRDQIDIFLLSLGMY
jgi:hypothetical protein